MSTVIYHLLALDCPDRPRDLMGSNHGVTWFPGQISCNKCRVEWDRRQEDGTAPPLDDREPRLRTRGAK